MLTTPTLAKPTVHLFNFIRSSDKLLLVFGFRSSVTRYALLLSKYRFAQVTERQFIDYQPNYASVFFGDFVPLIVQARGIATVYRQLNRKDADVVAVPPLLERGTTSGRFGLEEQFGVYDRGRVEEAKAVAAALCPRHSIELN